MTQSNIRIIGLTGNTGSGKTSVAAILQSCGGFIIDADKLVHNAIKAGQRAYADIVEYFGYDILEQNNDKINTEKQIDRKRLGSIVFSDMEKKKKLEEITHKYVLEDIDRLINEIKANPRSYRFIVIDAPLLIESGLHNLAENVWVVYAPDDIRLSRIIIRDGLTAEQAKQRMTSQTEFSKLQEYADEIIENTGDLDSLEQSVKLLLNRRL